MKEKMMHKATVRKQYTGTRKITEDEFTWFTVWVVHHKDCMRVFENPSWELAMWCADYHMRHDCEKLRGDMKITPTHQYDLIVKPNPEYSWNERKWQYLRGKH
jgi:hypothetical protein